MESKIDVTRTEDGESVIVAGVTMAPGQVDDLIRALEIEARAARGAAEDRRCREQAGPRVAAWKERYPEHIVHGDGFVHVDSRGVESIGATSGRAMAVRVQEIPAYPTPVRMRMYAGRVAHIWQGGRQSLCGRYIGNPAALGLSTPDCPKCATALARRGGA